MKTSTAVSSARSVRPPDRNSDQKNSPSAARQEQAPGGPRSAQHDTASGPSGAARHTAPRSGLLALWLLASGWRPRHSVAELRRKARYAGLNMTRTGRPIKVARRAELLELLGVEQ